jgi:hypothetical protein
MFVGKARSPPYSGTHERLASDKHYSLLGNYMHYKNMAFIVAVLRKAITFAIIICFRLSQGKAGAYQIGASYGTPLQWQAPILVNKYLTRMELSGSCKHLKLIVILIMQQLRLQEVLYYWLMLIDRFSIVILGLLY